MVSSSHKQFDDIHASKSCEVIGLCVTMTSSRSVSSLPACCAQAGRWMALRPPGPNKLAMSTGTGQEQIRRACGSCPDMGCATAPLQVTRPRSWLSLHGFGDHSCAIKGRPLQQKVQPPRPSLFPFPAHGHSRVAATRGSRAYSRAKFGRRPIERWLKLVELGRGSRPNRDRGVGTVSLRAAALSDTPPC